MPKRKSKKLSLVEYHYDIDKETFALKGAAKQDENFDRDVHDWFNIIALIPICIANGLNWSFGEGKFLKALTGTMSITELWTGQYFLSFFWLTFAYFLTDALWVLIRPTCVKSPNVILGHHFTTLFYVLVPYFFPEYGWLMGACMSVEVNTWLIIARRLFNKTGEAVFTFTALTPGGPLKIKLVSILFYTTWVVIRVLLYPALFFVVAGEYWARWTRCSSPINVLMVAPPLQLVFVFLNFKWTYDLLLSKLRSKDVSKGL